MVFDIALVAEYDLLSFAAGRIRTDGVEGTSAVGLYNVRIAARFDIVVVREIDARYVDRIADVLASVACQVDLLGGYVVGSLIGNLSAKLNRT